MTGFKDLGTRSIWSAHKNEYETLTSEWEDLFPTKTDVFNIAAAIGLKDGGQKEVEANDKEFLANQIDNEKALYLVMQSRCPDLSDEERLKELAKFAEYGIEILFEKVEESGTYDPEKF